LGVWKWEYASDIGCLKKEHENYPGLLGWLLPDGHGGGSNIGDPWETSKMNHNDSFIELDDGKIYRKALYLMGKSMVSCRFSLKPIQ
jgi:hypothetical protein